MDLNFTSIFSTPLYVGKCLKDIDPLLKECEQHKSTSDGRSLSNKGGWQSGDLNGKNIKKYIGNQLQDIAYTWGIRGIISPSNYWFNVNFSGSYNSQHSHPGSILSGILYLKCPENSSPITFCNPNSSLIASYITPFIDFDFTPQTSLEYSLPIKEGQLVIFPSWLEHKVDSRNFEGERISLSFNTKVEVPSTRRQYTFQQ